MEKLYFIENNAGCWTVLEIGGQSCMVSNYYFEGDDRYPPNLTEWVDLDDAEQDLLAEKWLDEVASWGTVESLWSDFSLSGVYGSVSEEFNGEFTRVLATRLVGDTN